MRETLSKRGLDLGKAEAARVFTEGSRAGDMATFHASVAGTLIVAAIGARMNPHDCNTPTDLIVYIKRAVRRNAKERLPPPDPLAEPLMDVNILPGRAHAYQVKKGQWIQIVDVQGRECSDFQAFSQRKLDAGIEHEIDPTTTHSLMGLLSPKPGLHSKFWTVDQEPLVEVIQDDVGRHDTFGTACTARYYEDVGYPGHVNCSDNINGATAQFGLKPRAAWPALNFFFNTSVDDHHQISLDDPWTRPGDHLLLQALDDLVCVSTACPSDIDATNGWDPTDIQVRLYAADEMFKRSVGWRASVEADLQETQKTGFHDCFARHTRDFVEYNGYWLANKMTNHGAQEEYWACREKAVVMDLSPLRKYEVTGPDAEKLMQMCVTRNIKKLAVGGVVYTAMCYEHGGMIDDGTVFRLCKDLFRWVGGNDTSGQWMREQAEKHGLQAWVRNSTDQLHNIAVQGPNSRKIMEAVFWTPPDRPTMTELEWFRFTPARIGDLQGTAVVVSRTGYTGELGYEVFCHPRDAVAVFDAIWDAGQEHGLIPFGLEALDMVRTEAGLIFAGYEFDDTTDPFEAGIGFTVPLKSQEDDFIGRAAIERRKANPRDKLVGLDVSGGMVPSHGDCVRLGKAQVGVVTSAVKSPILGKVIALARVDVTVAEEGTALEVGQLDGHQKRLPATVCRFAHFDPTKERAKGNYEASA
jgi:aminomethyltransferase